MQTRSWKWTPLFYIQRFSISRLQLKFRIYFSSMEKEKINSRQKKSQGLWKSQNSNEMHLSLYFFHLVNIEGLIRCDIKASIADKVHQSCQGQNEGDDNVISVIYQKWINELQKYKLSNNFPPFSCQKLRLFCLFFNITFLLHCVLKKRVVP